MLDDDFQRFNDNLERHGYVFDESTKNTPIISWRKGIYSDSDSRVTVLIEGKILTEIDVAFDPEKAQTPTLGDLVLFYGASPCVWIASNYLMLKYLNKNYALSIIANHLAFTRTIYEVNISRPLVKLDCASNQAFDWRGFGSTRRYFH